MQETGEDGKLLKMLEEDIIDESQHIASLTVNKENKGTMDELVKATAAMCFIYDEDYGNLVQKHELAVEENLTEYVHFVLVDFS